MSETKRRHYVWRLKDKRHRLKGYAGRGQPLSLIHILFSCTHPVENPKIFSSTVRGLALYHYLNGRLDAAYRIPVSYTHLDVYKRQIQHNAPRYG